MQLGFGGEVGQGRVKCLWAGFELNMLPDKTGRYAVALAVSLLALYIRYLLMPYLGMDSPYQTVWLAVAFCSWFLGLGPSVLSTMVCALGVSYFFLEPIHTLGIRSRVEQYGMASFLIFAGAMIALGESNRRGAASRGLLAAIVDSSDDAIISQNLNGIITSWNSAAERMFGWTAQEALGKPLTIIVPPDLRDEKTDTLKQPEFGERIDRLETVRMKKSGERIDVALTVSAIRDQRGRIVGTSRISRDITQRKQAEAQLKAAHEQLEQRVSERTAELWDKNRELQQQGDLVRQLSGRLLQLQDEERRRIARELHDSVGQMLAAISMNISKVSREKGKLSPDTQKCIEENASLVSQTLTEIRTMSHLLHPPLLDEVGLGSALKWFIEGFAQRSKIEVQLEIPEEFERLNSELEIAIFRIVQECLTNIHRHSGSPTAEIHVSVQEGSVRCEVVDQGKGIPPEKQSALNSSGSVGVGFRGMRERVRQLGGTLQVDSNGHGTAVKVVLPLPQARTAGTGTGLD